MLAVVVSLGACSKDGGGEGDASSSRIDAMTADGETTGNDAADATVDDDTTRAEDANGIVDSSDDTGGSGSDDTSREHDTTAMVDILVCNNSNWTSDCDYKSLGKASSAAMNGDVVGIRKGTYKDCTKWDTDNLTIRGVDGRPHFKDKTCGRKGIFIIAAGTENVTVENIEFSGMKVRDENGAGIRHHGGNLTVRNIYAHDGQEGILAGDGKHTITIENSKFERLGKNGMAHGIYINKIDKLVVRNSEFLSSKSQGHEFKTRARETVVECSTIASLDGKDSRSFDIPNGGKTVLRKNVIEQGPSSVNSGIVGYAAEGAGNNHPQDFTMEDNILINDLNKGTFIRIYNPNETSATIQNNKFYGPGTELDGASLDSSNMTDLDRKKDFGSYPKLPDPPCP